MNNIQALISKANELGYRIYQIEEGGVGYGHMLLIAPDRNHWSFEIKEQYLNHWSSDHDVRRFRKLSKRIEKLIFECIEREIEEVV